MTLIAAAAALAAAGCGGGDDQKDGDVAGTATTTSPATSAPATEGKSPSSVPETAAPQNDNTVPEPAPAGPAVTQASPGRGCLTGSYRSLSFASKRSLDSPLGAIELSGRGRGLALEFSDTRWTMRGVGRRPMHGKVLGIKGTLKINGSAHGGVTRVPGRRLRFHQSGSEGTVTVTGLGQSFELPVSAVAPAVVPDGRAKLTCSGDRLTIDSASGVLRLARP